MFRRPRPKLGVRLRASREQALGPHREAEPDRIASEPSAAETHNPINYAFGKLTMLTLSTPNQVSYNAIGNTSQRKTDPKPEDFRSIARM